MNALDFLEAHPVTYTIFVGPALLAIFPQGRRWTGLLWRKLGQGKRNIEAKIDLILSEVADVKGEVSEIKAEVQFSNDTSTKQEVALLKKRSHLDFWMKNKPSIEMDGTAQVVHVSETLCRLLGVWSPADLYMRNWLRCVEAGRVDEFLNAFVESVKFKSDFDFLFKLQTKDGSDQGQWKLMMSDVTPQGYSKEVYSGYFKPIDERAKEVAEGLHWSR